MSKVDDLRGTLESTFGLNPEKAQRLAKGLLEPKAAREQVGKAATDVLEWSQRNRERFSELIRGEIAKQLRVAGVATRADLDALTKRVRALERATSSGATKRKPAARKPAAKKPAAKKPAGVEPPAPEGAV